MLAQHGVNQAAVPIDRAIQVGPLRATCTAIVPACFATLPWQGRPVSLQFRSRRFRCILPDCSRRTFTERLDDVAGLHARRTERVSTLHRCIGLAVSGEAGARLAERLAMPVSPDTLLRAACQASRDAKLPVTPRVLGVDDWAELAKVPAAQPLEG